MKVIKLLPVILGGAGVVQAGLNKTIAQSYGLSTASLINGVMVALCAAALFGVVYYWPGWFPDIVVFKKSGGESFKWWYLVPGIIGFSMVFVIPLMIFEVGALPVFLGVIAGQIMVGMIWDACLENIPVSTVRMAGAALTFIGAILAMWKK
jgi:bacterial/archaeal transporter family-2 protein